jgi:Family of unknown function (DUF6879)
MLRPDSPRSTRPMNVRCMPARSASCSWVRPALTRRSLRLRPNCWRLGRLGLLAVGAYMAGWMAMVRGARAAGKRFERVRIVPAVLTEYLRLELRGNRYNAAAGEDIRYLDRDQAEGLDLPDQDFWLFDGQRLALQCFTPAGRPLGALVVTEPSVVAQHALWLDRAWARAVPYADYLAADPSREHPAGPSG